MTRSEFKTVPLFARQLPLSALAGKSDVCPSCSLQCHGCSCFSFNGCVNEEAAEIRIRRRVEKFFSRLNLKTCLLFSLVLFPLCSFLIVYFS